jgi:hypothetical protein
VHERLGTDDRDNIQDRREPLIQVDQEPAIAVREPDPTLNPTPQDDQLMPERRYPARGEVMNLPAAAV